MTRHHLHHDSSEPFLHQKGSDETNTRWSSLYVCYKQRHVVRMVQNLLKSLQVSALRRPYLSAANVVSRQHCTFLTQCCFLLSLQAPIVNFRELGTGADSSWQRGCAEGFAATRFGSIPVLVVFEDRLWRPIETDSSTFKSNNQPTYVDTLLWGLAELAACTVVVATSRFVAILVNFGVTRHDGRSIRPELSYEAWQ